MRWLLLTLIGCFILPWVGTLLAGSRAAQYLEFPPRTIYVEHASFSWLAFFGLAAGIVAVIGPFLFKAVRALRDNPSGSCHGRWPWWGWLGIGLTAATWTMAWNRFDWFAPFQKHTFFPLWFGYILTVNALVYWRKGSCLMTVAPPFFISLFPLSAVFWWMFEWLNRFVQNWEYLGVEAFSPFGYFLFASLAFSTVLPAVAATRDLLGSFPAFSKGFDDGFQVPWIEQPTFHWGLMALGCGGLLLVGILPNILYPLLWLAPLFVLVALRRLNGHGSTADGIAQGNWNEPVVWAAAALICGVFWEMWNVHSQAKWVYHVPYVEAFHIFEMPLLGYTGYLPFGWMCAEVVWFFSGPSHRTA